MGSEQAQALDPHAADAAGAAERGGKAAFLRCHRRVKKSARRPRTRPPERTAKGRLKPSNRKESMSSRKKKSQFLRHIERRQEEARREAARQQQPEEETNGTEASEAKPPPRVLVERPPLLFPTRKRPYWK